MKQVSKDQFFAAMNPLDVHPCIQPGPYPYTSLWKLRRDSHGAPLGKSVGKSDGTNDYYLAEG